MNDPYTDTAQWLDMDARTESIMRHPVGKKLGDVSGVGWQAMCEQAARAEADSRYSGDHHHAFIEGALWATRHVIGQDVPDVDQAVFVVRDSDVAAIEVEQCGSQMVAGDVSAAGPEQARRFAQDNLQRVAAHEAIARAIEQEDRHVDQ